MPEENKACGWECIGVTVVAFLTGVFGIIEIFWSILPEYFTNLLGAKAKDPNVWASNQGVYTNPHRH